MTFSTIRNLTLAAMIVAVGFPINAQRKPRQRPWTRACL